MTWSWLWVLVMNVDLLMIFFLCVKGPVGFLGKKCQPMMPRQSRVCVCVFMSVWVCFCVCVWVCPTTWGIVCVWNRCVLVLTYCRQWRFLSFLLICPCLILTVCGFACVSRNLCDHVLNYFRQGLFLSCLMIFSGLIMSDYVQMINQ